MKTSPLLALAIVLGASVSSLKAEFSINVEYAALFRSDGTTQIGPGFIGILVADEGAVPGISDPFDTELTVGNYLGGSSDDLIIGLMTSVADVADTGFSGFQQDFTELSYTPNFTVGDKLYLLWFPTISVVGSTVGSGVSYGLYRSDTVNTVSGADIAFVAPTDGFAYNMSAYLESIAPGSGVTVPDFTSSNITAVPEPSVYGLVGVAAIGLILLRHRARRCG